VRDRDGDVREVPETVESRVSRNFVELEFSVQGLQVAETVEFCPVSAVSREDVGAVGSATIVSLLCEVRSIVSVVDERRNDLSVSSVNCADVDSTDARRLASIPDSTDMTLEMPRGEASGSVPKRRSSSF